MGATNPASRPVGRHFKIARGGNVVKKSCEEIPHVEATVDPSLPGTKSLMSQISNDTRRSSQVASNLVNEAL